MIFKIRTGVVLDFGVGLERKARQLIYYWASRRLRAYAYSTLTASSITGGIQLGIYLMYEASIKCP